jgi:2-C-methyl-D-erythritol 2,4-cyclodiphosphate synthase
MRIGHGYDAHRLVEGRRLVIGGTLIPYDRGLEGHSDADVLVHAVMDAMLGAAALGDIGKMFPDSDPETEGISSMILLDDVATAVAEAGFTVHNLDCTIIAQKPKLAAHLPRMRNLLAKTLDVPADHINIKATTEEHMGFTGREEGISAHAVVLLYEPGDR